MLSDGRAAANDKDGLVGVLATSAFNPRRSQSEATPLLVVVQAKGRGGETDRDGSRLVEGKVVRDLLADIRTVLARFTG